jgi:hypothetical protein
MGRCIRIDPYLPAVLQKGIPMHFLVWSMIIFYIGSIPVLRKWQRSDIVAVFLNELIMIGVITMFRSYILHYPPLVTEMGLYHLSILITAGSLVWSLLNLMTYGATLLFAPEKYGDDKWIMMSTSILLTILYFCVYDTIGFFLSTASAIYR